MDPVAYTRGLLDRVPLPLPDVYKAGMSEQIIISVASMIGSAVLVAVLSPKTWARLNFAQRIMLPECITAAVASINISINIWPEVMSFSQSLAANEPGFVTGLPTAVVTDKLWYTCGISAGYLLIDVLVLLIFGKSFTTGERYAGQMRPAMYYQMVIHHLGSIVFWPYSLYNRIMPWFVAFCLFTEMTNPLLNTFSSTEIIGYKDSSVVQLTLRGFWFIHYTIVRILPSPILMYVILNGNYDGISTFDKALAAVTVPIPFYLNFLWYWLILKKAKKAISGISSKSADKGGKND